MLYFSAERLVHRDAPSPENISASMLPVYRCPLKTGQLSPSSAEVARGRRCAEAALARDGESSLSAKDGISCGPGANSDGNKASSNLLFGAALHRQNSLLTTS